MPRGMVGIAASRSRERQAAQRPRPLPRMRPARRGAGPACRRRPPPPPARARGPPAPPARARQASGSMGASATSGRRSRCSTSVRARPRSEPRSPYAPSASRGMPWSRAASTASWPSSSASVSHVVPRLGEEQLGLRVVGGAEARHHAALQRPLAEDGRAQGMDGRDLRALDGLQRRRPRARRTSSLRRGIEARLLQPLAQPQLHGGGGVLGEGHGRDLVEAHRPRAQQRLDAVDEQRGLAGAGAGLDDEARAVVAARPLAGRFVDGKGPRAHPTSRMRSTRCTRGSLIL